MAWSDLGGEIAICWDGRSWGIELGVETAEWYAEMV